MKLIKLLRIVWPHATSRRKSEVHSQLECVVDHAVQIRCQNFTRLLQAGVRVDFYQPHAQICVNQEVVAEKLEAALFYGELASHSLQT